MTERCGTSNEVGDPLLGYHEDGELRYGGSVGTGWGSKTSQDSHNKLVNLQIDKPAVKAALVKLGR